jgi:AcrR family transcriptional regulator
MRMAKSRAIREALADPSDAQVTEKPPSPRSLKGVRTRERLVEAAKEIFEKDGFLEARISDIASRAGQSHGSFYYYFNSKEEIFREVAAAVDERLFAPMDEVIMAHSALAPRQRVREAMRRHFERYREEARIIALIEQVSGYDKEVNALRLSRFRRHTERAAERIRQLQRRKLADPKLDPLLAAAALGALTSRFAEMWLVHRAVESTLEHAVDQVSRILTNAISLSEA